ncbi:MAG: hypothetical protein KDJ75_08290 [Alphaproteobacteria bacterium]|nr:hypothetical protein [Alphaproteobacteria bacterium]
MNKDLPVDIHVLEILASKICHDLISPIGAVNNGIEFLEEMGADAGDEVVELIAFSAGQASAKLRAYRMAYGAGGADTSIKPEDVHAVIEAMVGAEKKIVQKWDPYAPLGPAERPAGLCKILVSALLLAMDCLPKGGELSVEGQGEDSIIVTARGENAGLREGVGKALSLDIADRDVEPKVVHAYVTGLLARRYGLRVSAAGDEGGVRLTIGVPPSLSVPSIG